MRPTLAHLHPFTSNNFPTSGFCLRPTHKGFMWDCSTSLFEFQGYVMLNLRPCLAVWEPFAPDDITNVVQFLFTTKL